MKPVSFYMTHNLSYETKVGRVTKLLKAHVKKYNVKQRRESYCNKSAIVQKLLSPYYQMKSRFCKLLSVFSIKVMTGEK